MSALEIVKDNIASGQIEEHKDQTHILEGMGQRRGQGMGEGMSQGMAKGWVKGWAKGWANG